MKKLILVLSSVLLGISNIMAAPADSSITLKGGDVGPLQILNVSLKPLLPNVYYYVLCQIVNNSNVNITVFFNQYNVLNPGWISINSGGVSSDGISGSTIVYANYHVEYENGEFDSKGLEAGQDPDASLQFINTDLSNTISVEDCIATPKVGSPAERKIK